MMMPLTEGVMKLGLKGKTMDRNLSTAMTTRLSIDTAVETSWTM